MAQKELTSSSSLLEGFAASFWETFSRMGIVVILAPE